MKSIVIYFSQSGNTKRAAQYLAKKTQADLVELQSVESYPSNFDDLAAVAEKQYKADARPEIANDLDLSAYDQIYLGFPTWYQRPPMIINSFFDKFDLANKTIVPFVTSGSSSVNDSMPYLEKMGTVQPGFTANNNEAIDRYLE